MSYRKREAIMKAAAETAQLKAGGLSAAATAFSPSRARNEHANRIGVLRWLGQMFRQPARCALVVGAVFLLAAGIIGASVGSNSNSGGAAAAFNTIAVTPSPTPTPQLAKEYIYAGARMLAVEEAGNKVSNASASDLVVWRLSGGSGYWYTQDGQNGSMATQVFGMTDDLPAPADYDGDGLYDFCVYRPSTGFWYLQPNGNGSAMTSQQFGISTDVPVAADYDGDGRADYAIWRDQAGVTNKYFYILQSATNTVRTEIFGQAGDTPLPADYDGDGQTDIATYRLAAATNYYEWRILRSSDAAVEAISYGDAANGDQPVTGDFNGDGRFDVAVRRVGTNQWVVRNVGALSFDLSGFTLHSSDRVVAGDYDADGKTDAAVWRPSNGVWYIRQSSKEGQPNQLRQTQWGTAGDVPIAAPYQR